MVIYLLPKIVVRRPCGSRDVIFYVTWQDYVVKRFFDFMEASFILYIPTLPSLVAKEFVEVGI